jgi:hypothetical protein
MKLFDDKKIVASGEWYFSVADVVEVPIREIIGLK